MTRHALFVGGTRFIGRRAVREFRDAGYDVTVFHRGEHESPFADDGAVDHLRGDRTDDGDLADAAARDPDVVVDLVAYQPRDVRAAARAFDDVDAYVYVSSGAAYGAEDVPKREDETPLEPCTEQQATDDSQESYGARKAEGDRAVFAAAEDGVNAMSVRPCVVYGPHDYTRRFDYWVQRVANYDRVLVPGDGTNLWHRVGVENVARALRVVAEEGTPGEAYNVGDWRLQTLRETVETVADALDTEVEVVTAGERELAAGGLEPGDFPLYRDPPHVLDTNKLRSLGWEPQSPREAVAETVEATPEREADEAQEGPDRETEERVLGVLDTL
ncbi:NAD-dependent epimerase/dehydratase family protein [Halosimplex halophilum]|uniref:NAD-dependent epimerase/dehydratase family protein n=1 Tax=Halosimplex halophilum TaxID=2559572 RepID=UPI00107FB779|nr:NAD-dependent epimerase/dehydratase family protein [Halosimplex halophilum]